MGIPKQVLTAGLVLALFVVFQLLCINIYAFVQTKAREAKVVKEEFTPVNLLSCPACTFPPRYLESDSTENDAIFSVIENETTNIFPFIRSLRTTYTRAKLILFITEQVDTKFDKNMRDFLNACGVTVFKYPTLPSPRNTLHINFLKGHMTTFDRILIVDFIDTAFQGDPFHSKFPRDRVGILGTMIAGTSSNVYKYLMHDTGIRVEQYSDGVEYATADSALSGKITMHKIGFFKANNANQYPLVILGYDKVQGLRDSIGWACNKVFKSPDPLMRYMA